METVEQASSGTSLGLQQSLGIVATWNSDPLEENAQADRKRFTWTKPCLLACYAWTTTLSEMFIEIETVDEFTFTCLVHFVVDTPVHAATDHPDWQDDVVLVFELRTESDAHITSVTHMFRRGCGRYLREIPAQRFASEVAWPVRNASFAIRGGTFRLRVTAC